MDTPTTLRRVSEHISGLKISEEKEPHNEITVKSRPESTKITVCLLGLGALVRIFPKKQASRIVFVLQCSSDVSYIGTTTKST
jgi:hypothetical protein